MSKISKTLFSAIAAVVISSLYFPSVNAGYSLKGDISGDNVIGGGDMKLLQEYILNNNTLTQEQAERADVNSDGCIDSFDLALAKKNLYSKLDKLPQGTWIADGNEGVRYYNFTNGTVIDQTSGKTTDFSCKLS